MSYDNMDCVTCDMHSRHTFYLTFDTYCVTFDMHLCEMFYATGDITAASTWIAGSSQMSCTVSLHCQRRTWNNLKTFNLHPSAFVKHNLVKAGQSSAPGLHLLTYQASSVDLLCCQDPHLSYIHVDISIY